MTSVQPMRHNDAPIEIEDLLNPSSMGGNSSPASEKSEKRPSGFLIAAPRQTAAIALWLGDAAVFLAAWAVLAPFGAAAGTLPRMLAVIAVAGMGLFWLQGLYPGYRMHGYELLRRRCAVMLGIGAVAASAMALLVHDWHGALFIALYLALTLAAQPLARAAVRGRLWSRGLWGERAAVLGDPRLAAEIRDYFTRHWQYGVRPAPLNSEGPMPSVALLAGESPTRAEDARLRQLYSEVILLADLPGNPIAGLRPAEIGGAIGVRLGGTTETPRWRSALRGMLDRAVAACLALVALPVLLAAAAAIYAVDPGPVIYRQTREGLRGRPFRVLKLRTMYQDADKRLEDLLASAPEARESWTTHFKLRHDPRILPWIGGLLRSTSLDELPQLLNVIAGDMRLVGPRPFPIYHLAAMDRSFRIRRRQVVPGLTGLWQISERSEADLERQQQLDDFYIENQSFWFDMHVLLKTVPAVVRGDGAY